MVLRRYLRFEYLDSFRAGELSSCIKPEVRTQMAAGSFPKDHVEILGSYKPSLILRLGSRMRDQ